MRLIEKAPPAEQLRSAKTSCLGERLKGKEEPMALYCGIDLHSSNCQVVVLDQSLAR
jgi:hypothetical protein